MKDTTPGYWAVVCIGTGEKLMCGLDSTSHCQTWATRDKGFHYLHETDDLRGLLAC